MNNKEKIKMIKKFFPENYNAILDSLTGLNYLLNEISDISQKRINDNIINKNFDESEKYLNLMKEINIDIRNINSIFNLIDKNNFKNKKKNKSNIKDYSKYEVNHEVEHKLTEDFTFKRPYAFKLNEKNKIFIDTWQQMFIKVCELLCKLDCEKFMRFEKLTRMNGRKKLYYSKNPAKLRKPYLINEVIYVELNKSSNELKKQIIKLLKEYDFDISKFIVYLRADYSD